MDYMQYVSQYSCDLSEYLPENLEIEDVTRYKSHEILLNVFGSCTSPDEFQIIPEPFESKRHDNEALEAFMYSNQQIQMTNISSDADRVSENLFDQYPIPNAQKVNNRSNVHPVKLPLTSSNKLNKMSRYNSNKLHTKSIEDDNVSERFIVYDNVTGRQRRPLLHEFIRIVLEQNQYSHIAEYIDRTGGIFKLHKPKQLAELWKLVKGRNTENNMTYDKLARAIRYYYRSGIMHSYPGRFTFRLGLKSGFGTEWWPCYA